MSAAPHMVNAARELELILGELYPEQSWIVEIRKPDAHDRPGSAPVAPRVDEPPAMTHDAHAALDRDDAATAAGARDEHSFDEAA